MQAAIKTGEVREIKGPDGVMYYVKREMEAGREFGKKGVIKIGGSRQIPKEVSDMILSKLKSLKWDFAPSVGDARSIEDKDTIPSGIKAKMNLAVTSTEKLIKEAEKVLGGLRESKSGRCRTEGLVMKLSDAEEKSNVVSKMLRLNIGPSNEPLTLHSIVSALGACADATRPLFDELQVCKHYLKK